MGNTKSQIDNDTINWNKINTDDISLSAPHLKGINNDALKLIEKLNIPDARNDSEDFDIDKLFQRGGNDSNVIRIKQFQGCGDDEHSDTSPFISPEMYNQLMKTNQTGGADEANTETSTTEMGNDESSDVELEAATSDSDNIENSDEGMDVKDSEEETDEEDEEDKKKKEKSEDDEEKEESDEEKSIEDEVPSMSEDMLIEKVDEQVESSEMSGGYESSSAHTMGHDSNTSEELSTISVGNKKILSDSINTSDINLVSIE